MFEYFTDYADMNVSIYMFEYRDHVRRGLCAQKQIFFLLKAPLFG